VMALTMLRHTQGSGVPIAVRMTEQAGLGALIGGARESDPHLSELKAVGMLEATCDLEVLVHPEREARAKAIHGFYVRGERAKGKTVAENPSMVTWAELPERLRDSNRGQADDIPAKMAAIGMKIVSFDECSSPSVRFTEDEVERLAEREHRRWLVEHPSPPWTPGPVKDEARMTSPALLPWEDLDPEDREKDREAVRHIPEVLAHAGFALIRES
jgi:hypothetical protein